MYKKITIEIKKRNFAPISNLQENHISLKLKIYIFKKVKKTNFWTLRYPALLVRVVSGGNEAMSGGGSA